MLRQDKDGVRGKKRSINLSLEQLEVYRKHTVLSLRSSVVVRFLLCLVPRVKCCCAGLLLSDVSLIPGAARMFRDCGDGDSPVPAATLRLREGSGPCSSSSFCCNAMKVVSASRYFISSYGRI